MHCSQPTANAGAEHTVQEIGVKLADFDYNLPEELIAQEPLPERDQSRLLVLNRSTGDIEHRRFTDIVHYINSDDIVVMNDTRVTAKRMIGKKPTGGSVEALLIDRLGGGLWRAMVKPGRRVSVGTVIEFGKGTIRAEVVDRIDDGGRILKFDPENEVEIENIAEVPLPPYIQQKLNDPERYQTIYSRYNGSAAAPTAGLHFTSKILEALKSKGVEIVFVTLHVGIATFRPVRVENILDHEMHSEKVVISEEAAQKINSCRGRVVCVGTTTARALESASTADLKVRQMNEETRLFITPGYKFKIVDALLTNFHMPKSTLIIMLSAFAGRDKVMKAYEEAVRERYRFLSFGDAMFVY